MVHCGPHEGRHTGALVAKKLDEIINSLEFPDDCMKTMTTDNAANMKVACKDSFSIDMHLGCFDHTLNLVVNAGVNSVEKIKSAIDSFKKLATECHKSSLYCERIKRACSDLNSSASTTNPVKYCKMITPVETRWNSSLMMMRSILQLRPALEAVKECTHRSTDSRLQFLIPERDDFELLESIVPILAKFETVSDFMSGENYPTICHVMVKVCFLQHTLKKAIESNQGLDDDSLREMCANMNKDLEKRFPNYGANEKAYAYTHLLHPGQKGTILYQLNIYNTTVQKMIEEEEKPSADVGLDVAIRFDSDEEDEEQAMLASMSQAMPKPNKSDDSPMMKEVIAFINGGLIPGKNLDVMAYWKAHEKEFPLLAKV